MHPMLFTLGPITLHSYGAMLVIAFVVSASLAAAAARRLPPERRAIGPEQLLDFCSCALLGGIVGGRVFYILQQWPLFARAPQEIVAIWHGGLVWYGGLLGGLMGGWLYARAKRLRFLRVLDQIIPCVALGHAIGRVGCLLNGCCYGKPTTLWCGIVFPGPPLATAGAGPGQGAPVLPTQLFEAIGLSGIFFLLRRLQRSPLAPHPGRVFGAYLLLYAVLRFFLEFLRGDQTAWWAGLTLPQVISMTVFLVGSMLLWGCAKRA